MLRNIHNKNWRITGTLVASARTAEEVKQISDTPAKLATYKEQYIKLEVKNRYIGRKIVVQR
jgi:hypothetical protein